MVTTFHYIHYLYKTFSLNIWLVKVSLESVFTPYMYWRLSWRCDLCHRRYVRTYLQLMSSCPVNTSGRLSPLRGIVIWQVIIYAYVSPAYIHKYVYAYMYVWVLRQQQLFTSFGILLQLTSVVDSVHCFGSVKELLCTW